MDSIEFGDKKFYVYHHLTQSGKVFYVGMGMGGRAFNGYRNKYWKTFVQKNSGKWTSSIVRWFSSRKEALSFEREEIIRLKPEINSIISLSDSRLKAEDKVDAGRKGGYRKWAKIEKSKRSEIMRGVALARWKKKV